jgi:hypothetical protein
MEKTELTQEQLLKKSIALNRYKVITNVILIIVILVITIYVIANIEAFKVLSNDVCKMCMDKTGATCFKSVIN